MQQRFTWLIQSWKFLSREFDTTIKGTILLIFCSFPSLIPNSQDLDIYARGRAGGCGQFRSVAIYFSSENILLCTFYERLIHPADIFREESIPSTSILPDHSENLLCETNSSHGITNYLSWNQIWKNIPFFWKLNNENTDLLQINESFLYTLAEKRIIQSSYRNQFQLKLLLYLLFS